MCDLYEEKIIKFESARNDAMDRFFKSRQHLQRTREQEFLFESGFRMAWEFGSDDNNSI